MKFNFDLKNNHLNTLFVMSAVLSILGISAHAEIKDNSHSGKRAHFDQRYFQIKDYKIRELKTEITSNSSEAIPAPSPEEFEMKPERGGDIKLDAPSLPDSSDALNLGQIINLGQQLWLIIESGKPSVSIETCSANALPEGTKNWQSLAGWKTPGSKVYEVSYRNFFGKQVVKFTYRVLYTYGGSVNSKGMYLTSIKVVPATVEVAWGFQFSAHVEIPSVTNAGTQENPLAAAEVLVGWKVDSVIKHSEGSSSYYLRGDGHFEDLSNGNGEESSFI